MRYLVTSPGNEPFFTNWFDAENNFNEGMTVYDLAKFVYTTDGINWTEIEEDHL